jgi:hypothetical protein
MHTYRIRRRWSWAVIALACTLIACSPQIRLDDLGEAVGGDPQVAAKMVDRWFQLARSGEEDAGWSLLYTNVRDDLIGSVEVYREAMAAVDWSAFDYQVGQSMLHDGRYQVDVHIVGGGATVPQPMCRWGLIQITSADDVPGVGTMQVRIPPLGDESGILGGSGC